MVIEPDNVQNEIYDLVTAERRRQDAKWGEQNHPFARSNEELVMDLGDIDGSVERVQEYVDRCLNLRKATWLGIAQEELFETAQAFLATMEVEGIPKMERTRLYEAFEKELVQTIAVLVQAFESCRRQRGVLESYLEYLEGGST